MMILSTDLGKFNTVCCSFDTENIRPLDSQTIASRYDRERKERSAIYPNRRFIHHVRATKRTSAEPSTKTPERVFGYRYAPTKSKQQETY